MRGANQETPRGRPKTCPFPNPRPSSFPRKREPRNEQLGGAHPRRATTPRPTSRHSRESGNPEMGSWEGPTPAEPTPTTPCTPLVIPAPTSRHSRESGNPGMGSWAGPTPAEPTPTTPCTPPRHSHPHPSSFPPLTVIPAKAGTQGWAAGKGQPPPSQPPPPPAPPLVIPTPTPHRHSRESGNPGMGGARGAPPAVPPPPPRHSRESGNPGMGSWAGPTPTSRHSRPSPSFPRKREPRDGQLGGTHPLHYPPSPPLVIPAKAGTQGWARGGANPHRANPLTPPPCAHPSHPLQSTHHYPNNRSKSPPNRNHEITMHLHNGQPGKRYPVPRGNLRSGPKNMATQDSGLRRIH